MVAMSAPEKNILLTTLSKEINHPSLSKPAPLKLKPYLLQGGEQQTHSCKAQGRSTLSSTGLLSRIKVSIMVGMHMGPMFFERQTERERESERVRVDRFAIFTGHPVRMAAQWRSSRASSPGGLVLFAVRSHGESHGRRR